MPQPRGSGLRLDDIYATLQRMHVDNREQKQSLADPLREQGRRFLIAIIVAAALGVAAIIVMGIVVARSAGG